MKQSIERVLFEASGGISVSQRQLNSISDYADLLATYDRANVIGTKNVEEILTEHIADSVSCLQHVRLRGANEVIDVGSGGGMPAIPLSILQPKTHYVLVESTGKKVEFLKHAISQLKLENVTVEKRRAEEIGVSDGHRGRYDFATARALARLDVIVEYCVPLLKVGGALISMKAAVSEEESMQGARAVALLGAELKEVRSVSRSSLQQEKVRNLAIVEKIRATPRRFPRGVGVPRKNPLGE